MSEKAKEAAGTVSHYGFMHFSSTVGKLYNMHVKLRFSYKPYFFVCVYCFFFQTSFLDMVKVNTVRCKPNRKYYKVI